MLLTRNVYIASALVCVCALVIWSIMSKKPQLSTASIHQTQQVSNTEKPIATQPTATNTTPTTVVTTTSYKEDYGVFGASPSDAVEVAQWKVSMGYTNADLPANEYTSYDEATLRKLADNGDVKAMLALGAHYTNSTNPNASPDVAAPFYHKAAVYGSTAALQRLGTIAEVEMAFSSLPAEQKHVAMLEVIALSKVAAIRGDKYPLTSILRKYEDEIQFTNHDFEFIDKRGQEIYNELQQQRNALGLGPFDNSVPDAVRRNFLSHAQYHESQKDIQYRYAEYEKSKQK